MDTIYRERSGGRWAFWTYSEGRRIAISQATAERWIARKTARLVIVR